MDAVSLHPQNGAASGSILCQQEGHATVVTLNRPEKMNALNGELVDALLQVVEHAAGNGTRLLVLKGSGKNFSAGFDFSGYEEASEGDLVLRLIRIEQLLQAVYYAPYYTVALAHGRNFGAGADLICSCSHRIAAAESTFRMPGLRFGLVLGTRRLAQRIGTDATRRILMQSVNFDAGEALTMGFLNELAQPEQWDGVIASLAKKSGGLSVAAEESLLRVTAPDTRADDLAELVTSASRPGLKERIRQYRALP
ncbi:MAG: enoyl-CoA hydratase/isomerase family protein [Herminiimonas sp.]|nr:enoyl-CoA hydratase/isomerase family protein [Herminiimonas sp.]